VQAFARHCARELTCDPSLRIPAPACESVGRINAHLITRERIMPVSRTPCTRHHLGTSLFQYAPSLSATLSRPCWYDPGSLASHPVALFYLPNIEHTQARAEIAQQIPVLRPAGRRCAAAKIASSSRVVSFGTFLCVVMPRAWSRNLGSSTNLEALGSGIRSSRLREFYGTRLCTVMHGPAIEATDAPIICIFNNRIHPKQVPHNAGVGGSNQPVATISQ